MSKLKKLFKDIKNNPKNVRFKDLQKLLLIFGFTEKQPKSGSSHYTYTSGKNRITIPKHYPVNEIYVKEVIKMLEEKKGES